MESSGARTRRHSVAAPLRQPQMNPIATRLFHHSLQGVADDAILTLIRTSRSHLARHALDCATAVLSASGELLAAGLGDPKHLSQVNYLHAINF